MLDPALLALDDTESRALFTSTGELFASEGFDIAWGGAERWYAARDDLQGLATASLDRVIGRNVDQWLRPRDAGDGRGARRAGGAVIARIDDASSGAAGGVSICLLHGAPAAGLRRSPKVQA